ncbi:hypothetical protein [Pseudoalteromonas lipolytica]|uniref:hypothetical protein n=1 Tax=Pseudoalteromonas lipolytica TaxID=570156 RepID=UPI0030A65863
MKLKIKGDVAKSVFDPTISLSQLKDEHVTQSEKQATLQKLHKKYWIACDCCLDTPAMMTVRRTNNQYFLVNIPGHGLHSSQCPFHYIPSKGQVDSKEKSSNAFVFNGTFDPTSSEMNTATSMSSLRNLLLFLVDKGDVNTITCDRTFSSNIHAILKTAISDVYVNGKEIEQRIEFGLDQFLKTKEKIQNELDNGLYTAPYFLFDVIDEIETLDKYWRVVKKTKGKVLHSFKFFRDLCQVSELSVEKGPFLLLTAVTPVKTKAGCVIAPSLTYFQPIANKLSWVPVNTLIERTVVEKIFSSIKWYNQKLGFSFSCSRLLKPIHNDLGRSHPLFKFELASQIAYFDIQFKKYGVKNTQRTLDYIVLSKTAGGAYCILDESQADSDIKNFLFSTINEVLKAIKNASEDSPVFDKQMKCISG